MPFHAAFTPVLPDLGGPAPLQSPIPAGGGGGGLGGLAALAGASPIGAALGGGGGIDAGSAIGDTTLGPVNFTGGSINKSGISTTMVGLIVAGVVVVMLARR